MKKLLLILLCLPMIGFGQLTMIPDPNFEQALINLGYDTGNPDGSVPTSNINTITSLSVSALNISDLTGIADFSALIELTCQDNQLVSLDVSNNANLDHLYCRRNQLSTLSLNNDIIWIWCDENQLASLDVSQCLSLEQLRCEVNKLTSLDLSQNISLRDELYLSYNELTSLNIKNGSNHWIVNNQFSIAHNPYLTCIEVDDPVYSSANWLNIDSQHYFSTNCGGTSVEEYTTNKELLKVTSLLGRETKQTNQPLFYIYDDGTVEKKITIE